jgi:hypothetical protein
LRAVILEVAELAAIGAILRMAVEVIVEVIVAGTAAEAAMEEVEETKFSESGYTIQNFNDLWKGTV